ncbi:polysaccharide pyruvyl transferase family protein [Paenibacillus apii]|uniref:polysaccharide pyruvyl transferase family protein n=1 Tax=Paenibacillus apii TaxID=1850370 RepID=UPI001439892F|nr:polysaccharide pyruvyl transferase family protein [Paenibacillus apii]NJJ41643.1 polysaccharide pyruvyl transferase family protein [Paenibacillus apii]
MKKIIINSYTEFNLGDDLFIKILCERYPNYYFVLVAHKNYKKTFQDLKNIKVYSSNSIFIRGVNFILRKLGYSNFYWRFRANQCDAIVQIGGSIFMQSVNWKKSLEQDIHKFDINKPYFLIGANFGPYVDVEYYNEYKKLFSKFTDVCFREKYSYELFKDLNNVRYAPDVVFNLYNPNSNDPNSEKKDAYIIISVIKPSYREDLIGYDEVYYKKIKEISIYFIEQGYNVQLMSFCDYEGDNEATEYIFNLLPSKYREAVKVYYYNTNIEEAIQIFSNSSFVIATRFHSMILGWLSQIPVFPIIYSNKMTNVISDAKFKGFYTDFKNLEIVQPEKVFALIKTNPVDVSFLAKEASKQFKKLDEYLSSEAQTINDVE